ncbi:MAG: sugar transferase [Balneolia bacterium]|nr:sugar transferase [Balneolia bacterium]
MIRFFDILFSFAGLIILSPLVLFLLVAGYFDTGSPIFRQERIGKEKKRFNVLKLRTMSVETASVASHLVGSSSITKWGAILRKLKLDELPQLVNVFRGEMSLVGPRPNLPNQLELIEERDKRSVYEVRPGITGIAQINNIDMSTPELLAKTDAEMITKLNLSMYFYLIFATVLGKGRGDAAGA